MTQAKGEVENPYLAGRRAWMEQYGDYIASANQWRATAIAALAVALFAVGGMVYTANQNTFIPYVIAVDSLGEAMAVGKANEAATADKRVVRAQIARFINNARSVYVDADAMRAVIDELMGLVPQGSAARKALNDQFAATSPFDRAKSETASVEVLAVLPMGGKTWRAEWRETIRTRAGEVVSVEDWQGSFTVVVAPPSDEPTILRNPLGVYIREFNWTRRLAAEGK